MEHVDDFSSPRTIVPMVMALTKPRKVADWGCNCGVWLKTFKDCGCKIQGFDVLPWDETSHLERSEFRQADFEKGVPIHKCDLALCLENAEHVAEEWANDLIDALCESAPIVMFSAATPGQGGDHHVNEQPHSYWHRKFFERGYGLFDWIRWAVMDDPAVYKWYRDNLFIYSRLPLPIPVLS